MPFLSANDVKFISVDRQKLDLSKYIYSYGTVNSIFVEIQSDSTNIKNDPRTQPSYIPVIYVTAPTARKLAEMDDIHNMCHTFTFSLHIK